MAVSLFAVFERWAYEIGRSHHGHHGRTDVRRDSSDRSVGIALTMWLCLASGIFVSAQIVSKYYNEARTHLSLQKDAPIPRAVQTVGQTLAVPILGGLYHQYIRA
jgi:fatty-acid desaturase